MGRNSLPKENVCGDTLNLNCDCVTNFWCVRNLDYILEEKEWRESF